MISTCFNVDRTFRMGHGERKPQKFLNKFSFLVATVQKFVIVKLVFIV